jgi:CheY-like chemotaxis protein
VAILLTLLQRCLHHLVLSTVLVVDDDPSNRFVIRMILEPAGYEVVEAGDGEAALHLLGPDPLPDVITTDLTMPNLTGEGLIERLRSQPRTASIPIIVVSGNYDAAHALHATGLVEAVVDKPIEHSALAECIRTLTSTAVGASMIRASLEYVRG